jgi:hypothetical protein
LESSKGRYPKWRAPQLVEDSPETGTSTGERRAWKLARGVRWGAGGKGLYQQYLACGLPNFCIGIIGSRADAEQIRQEVRQFIEHDLRLAIAEEKSHIRHSKKGVTFVGYELKTYSADRVIKLKRGTRHTWVKSLSEQIQLHIPQDKMQKFCAQRGYGNYATGKATHKPQWMNLTDAEIILAYNGEFRGLANYYALATGVKKTLHKLEWLWQTSLLKTLANKHKTGVNKIVKRLKTQEGLKLIVKREQETRYISVFRLKDLRKPAPHNPQLDVQLNGYLWTLSFSEVTKRLNRKRCEYCETTEGPFEVHHVRKLKDVAKGKAFWQRMMAARHRKTPAILNRSMPRTPVSGMSLSLTSHEFPSLRNSVLPPQAHREADHLFVIEP